MSVHAPAPATFSLSPLPSPPLYGRRSRSGTQSSYIISRPSSPHISRQQQQQPQPPLPMAPPQSPRSERPPAHSRRPSFDEPNVLLPAATLTRPPLPRNTSRSERLLRETLSADERVRERSRSRAPTRSDSFAPFGSPTMEGMPFCDDEDECAHVWGAVRAATSGTTSRAVSPHHTRRSRAASPPPPLPALPTSTRTAPASPRLAFQRVHTAGPPYTFASVPGTPARGVFQTLPTHPEPQCVCGGAALDLSLSRAPSGRGARRASTAPAFIGGAEAYSQAAMTSDDGPEPLTPPPTPPHTRNHHRRHSTHSTFTHFPACPLAAAGTGGAVLTTSEAASLSSSSSTSPSSSGASTPGTPPTVNHHSSSFNARTASAACRADPGYTSFSAVEGLGVPEGLDGEESEGETQAGMGGMLRRLWGKRT